MRTRYSRSTPAARNASTHSGVSSCTSKTSASVASSSVASFSGVGFEYRKFALTTRNSTAVCATESALPIVGATAHTWNATIAVATIASAIRRKHHALAATTYAGRNRSGVCALIDARYALSSHATKRASTSAASTHGDDPHRHEQQPPDANRRGVIRVTRGDSDASSSGRTGAQRPRHPGGRVA